MSNHIEKAVRFSIIFKTVKIAKRQDTEMKTVEAGRQLEPFPLKAHSLQHLHSLPCQNENCGCSGYMAVRLFYRTDDCYYKQAHLIRMFLKLKMLLNSYIKFYTHRLC